MDPFPSRIRDETAIGTWVNTNSPVVAELLAALGFDFITIDAEHAAAGINEVQAMCQAITAGNPDCTPLVRLPEANYETVKRHLDAGAKGIIAPLINTPEEAHEVVEAAKYPPEGRRGVGFARSNAYGTDFDASVPHDNEEILVCVQIEHAEAVNNIDAILAVDGIDAAFFGPYDLSASLDVTGQFDHPKFEEAIETAEAACRENDIVLGTHVVQPDVNEAIQRVEEGYRLLAYSLDITVLSEVYGTDLEAIRTAAE